MTIAITILLSVITVLLSVMSFFFYRFVNKVDKIDVNLNELMRKNASAEEVQKALVKEVDELEKSDLEIAKEQMIIQIKWDIIQDQWESMKQIILLK